METKCVRKEQKTIQKQSVGGKAPDSEIGTESGTECNLCSKMMKSTQKTEECDPGCKRPVCGTLTNSAVSSGLVTASTGASQWACYL